MSTRNIAYLLSFVLLALPLAALGLEGQHSLSAMAAPEASLSLASGGPALFHAGLRSEIDRRFAVAGPFFASLSFGALFGSPSAYSAEGLRYRGYASAFAGCRLGAFLPAAGRAASVEIGAALHAASWASSTLAFAMAEIQGLVRLRDMSANPFYSGWLRPIEGSGSLRAEAVLPFSFRVLSASSAFSLGLGICLRRDSFPDQDRR